MKSTAAIVIDGVLRKPVGGGPIPVGILLYRSLASVFNIVLLSDETHASEELAFWMLSEGIVSYGSSILFPRVDDPKEARVTQVNRARRIGYAVDLVVEPDPGKATALLQAGYNTLVFTSAAFTDPAWRPDTGKGLTPWDDLAAETARRSMLTNAMTG